MTLAALTLAYVIASVPFAVIIGRWIDACEQADGNLPDPHPLTSGNLSAASDGTRPVIPSRSRADMFHDVHAATANGKVR